MNPNLVGTWRLAAYSYVDLDDIPYIDDSTPDRRAIGEFLHAKGALDLSRLKACEGLELTIDSAGRYEERLLDNSIAVDWFNREGALERPPTPTKGRIRCTAVGVDAFIHADDAPSWMEKMRTRRNDAATIRYDNGDTIICDLLRPQGESLLRIMSVVTDEAYPTRIIARYERAQ